jgi:hypothetical protein
MKFIKQGAIMFYIKNCNGDIVGNVKGYRTMRGASRWAKTRTMQNLLWDTFYKKETDSNLVWEIVSNDDYRIVTTI